MGLQFSRQDANPAGEAPGPQDPNNQQVNPTAELYGPDRYTILEEVGCGQFGRVHLGYDKVQKMSVAIKEIALPDERYWDRAEMLNTKKCLEREKEVMQMLDHPNIIRLLDVYETKTHVYLVMTYCPGGDLAKYLRTKPNYRLPESLARKFLGDMAKAVQCMHEKHLLHRDLKAANFLLDDDKSPVPNIKLGDFGLSRVLDPADMAASWVGTPNHMAPEVIEQREYNHQADMWSLGVIFYVMLTGGMPFDVSSQPKYLRAIRIGIINVPSNRQDISEESWYIITRLLMIEPSERMTIEELIKRLSYPRSNAALALHKPYYELLLLAGSLSRQHLLLSISLYVYVLQSGKKFLSIKEHKSEQRDYNEKDQEKGIQACSSSAKKAILFVMAKALNDLKDLLKCDKISLQHCSVPAAHTIFCCNGLLLTEVEKETDKSKRKEKADKILIPMQAYLKTREYTNEGGQINAEIERIISNLQSGYQAEA